VFDFASPSIFRHSGQLDQPKIKFKMIDSSKVVTSDDTLLLSSYLRLFNYFYINSLDQNKTNLDQKPVVRKLRLFYKHRWEYSNLQQS
jgi:hypothetical protein